MSKARQTPKALWKLLKVSGLQTKRLQLLCSLLSLEYFPCSYANSTSPAVVPATTQCLSTWKKLIVERQRPHSPNPAKLGTCRGHCMVTAEWDPARAALTTAAALDFSNREVQGHTLSALQIFAPSLLPGVFPLKHKSYTRGHPALTKDCIKFSIQFSTGHYVPWAVRTGDQQKEVIPIDTWHKTSGKR